MNKKTIFVAILLGLVISLSGCVSSQANLSKIDNQAHYINGKYVDKDCYKEGFEKKYKLQCRGKRSPLHQGKTVTLITCSRGNVHSFGPVEEACAVSDYNKTLPEKSKAEIPSTGNDLILFNSDMAMLGAIALMLGIAVAMMKRGVDFFNGGNND